MEKYCGPIHLREIEFKVIDCGAIQLDCTIDKQTGLMVETYQGWANTLAASRLER